MNIEQYRALKAKEEAEANQAQQDPPPEEPKQDQPPATPEEPTTEETKEEPKLPETIEIEGIGEVNLDELKKGYLRQTDYTKKTQELSRKDQELAEAKSLYEHLKQNPQLAQQVLQTNQLPPNMDPTTTKIRELEDKMYDMMMEKEIETLQAKYEDFEAKDVVQLAHEKKMTNLEDAYLLLRSQQGSSKDPQADLAKLKEELRGELLKELEDEKASTGSIITEQDSKPVIEDNSPKISDSERRIAEGLKMSPEEYVKWRDVDKK